MQTGSVRPADTSTGIRLDLSTSQAEAMHALLLSVVRGPLADHDLWIRGRLAGAAELDQVVAVFQRLDEFLFPSPKL